MRAVGCSAGRQSGSALPLAIAGKGGQHADALPPTGADAGGQADLALPHAGAGAGGRLVTSYPPQEQVNMLHRHQGLVNGQVLG